MAICVVNFQNFQFLLRKKSSACIAIVFCKFYAPGLKGPPRASSNQVVRLSVILSHLQSAIFKAWVMIVSVTKLGLTIIYGFLTLH